MKLLIQRVKEARVEIEGSIVGQIQMGLLIYVCFEEQDTLETLEAGIHKLVNLRIFEDENLKMNNNIVQINGDILSVSQFTLSWDGRKGHRPSFDRSMAPNNAKIFYRKFNDRLQEHNINVEKGLFGAEMQVHSINDGPVTFHLNF